MSDAIAADITAEVPVETTEVSSEATESTEIGLEGEVETTGEETTEELQEELVEQIRQLKLKVDGQDIIEDLPFDITPEQAEYFTKQAQLARVSQNRMQETAELKKVGVQTEAEIKGFVEALKSDPIKVLESMGIDTKEMSVERLQAEAKKLEMSDEEREISDLKQKLKDHEEKKDAAEKQATLEKQERMRDQYAAEYEQDLMSAIDDSQLPKNPEIIQRLAQYMHTAIKLGIDLSFKDLIPMVHDSVRTDMSKLLGSLPVEEIMGVLGDENIQKIMAKRSPKVNKKAPVTPKDITDTATPKEKENPFAKKFKTGNMGDFFGKI